MNHGNLWWLPENEQWNEEFQAASTADPASWESFANLANAQLNFVQTDRLDKVAQRVFAEAPPTELAAPPVRLAVLGSSTVEHLIPAIRVALMRRRMWAEVYVGSYGQYHQELLDPKSALHAFEPTVILFAFDARHALGKIDPAMDLGDADGIIQEVTEGYRNLWETARNNFSCAVIQQTILPVFPGLLGNNERRLPGSPGRLVSQINSRLGDLADASGIDLLGIDTRAAQDGIAQWHDPVLWHRAKMEIAPPIAPLYGDLVARLIAAQSGRSYKCLVLDLDNTLWGGVVGDDGVEGLVLGQGSALGEAFVGFQDYARQLSRRGLILAVCSKNDEANALGPFETHPEMVLARKDIAAFVANWTDKATNLRQIAKQLNIGIDSLVFVDDNPFERNLVRGALPTVAVPELPEDPAHYAQCIADAGYFEATRITGEDLARTEQYRANIERESLRTSATDISEYLESLSMEMQAKPFDSIGLGRVTQLINKTNQFNLTTKRYSEQEVAAMMEEPDTFTLQVRLTDKFGDNGMISVVIAKPSGEPEELLIDTWLMSCRVLGREVENAILNLLAEQATNGGYKSIVGEYRPTPKNGLVRDHYANLGFESNGTGDADETRWRLCLDKFVPLPSHIKKMEIAA